MVFRSEAARGKSCRLVQGATAPLGEPEILDTRCMAARIPRAAVARPDLSCMLNKPCTPRYGKLGEIPEFQ
jgi:hypothetical protein